MGASLFTLCISQGRLAFKPPACQLYWTGTLEKMGLMAIKKLSNAMVLRSRLEHLSSVLGFLLNGKLSSPHCLSEPLGVNVWPKSVTQSYCNYRLWLWNFHSLVTFIFPCLLLTFRAMKSHTSAYLLCWHTHANILAYLPWTLKPSQSNDYFIKKNARFNLSGSSHL